MAKKVYITDIKNPSLTRAIRLKCMDCAGTSDNIRDCHICSVLCGLSALVKGLLLLFVLYPRHMMFVLLI